MKKDNYKKSIKNTIDLQITALKKLKKNIGNSFNEAVKTIGTCKSKIILLGVGKSQKIAALVSSSLSSCAAESYTLTAEDCVHGDLGSISKKDILVLFSNSGNTEELKPIISYANRNNIKLIGITSKKNSILYKASNIKILYPECKEAGEGGLVPSTSLIIQESIGSALVIAVMKYKKHGIKLLKKSHPAGSLSKKLLTVNDLMLKEKSKIPFVNENLKMKDALKVLRQKNLGVIIARNSKNYCTGIFSDGDLKRKIQKNKNLYDVQLKKVMTVNPIVINQESLAEKALAIMETNRITTLIVNSKKSKHKIVGLISIHDILETNIS